MDDATRVVDGIDINY